MKLTVLPRSSQLNPIHIADADTTVELSRVGGVNAPIGSRDPVYNFLCCWAIEVGDKWRYNDVNHVIVEKLINVVKRIWSLSVWSVSTLSTESVGSSRGLVANSVHTADRRDATVESRRQISTKSVWRKVETNFRWPIAIVWVISVPKIIVIGQFLSKTGIDTRGTSYAWHHGDTLCTLHAALKPSFQALWKDFLTHYSAHALRCGKLLRIVVAQTEKCSRCGWCVELRGVGDWALTRLCKGQFPALRQCNAT